MLSGSAHLPAPDTDADVIAPAVDALTRRTGFPVAFGGMVHDGAVHVSTVAGARTRNLDSLIVEFGRGLGGRAAIEVRPRLALDYRTAKGITHDYDRMVLGEGIATLFAVPVVVSDIVRGVLYCASWGQSPVADHTAKPAFAVAEEVAMELRVRDEVRRRLSLPPPSASCTPDTMLAARAQEELRDAYADLRRITAQVDDIRIRRELTAVGQRLAALSVHGAGVSDDTAALDVPLSPREVDVLACAAIGSTNAQIAAALGLKEATVKSYLSSAMAKLDAKTRYSAVAKARRAGILP